MGTVEKLILENTGIVFGILSLGGTEPEIHLGSFTPPPQLQRTFLPRDSYAKRGICRRRVSVCLSVCLCVCVCLTHSGIASKRINEGSRK